MGMQVTFLLLFRFLSSYSSSPALQLMRLGFFSCLRSPGGVTLTPKKSYHWPQRSHCHAVASVSSMREQNVAENCWLLENIQIYIYTAS